MINNDYLIDIDWCSSGGYCEFMPIRNEPTIGFKEFKFKDRALDSLKYQTILSKYDLAPKPITGLCKVPYYYDIELLRYWNPKETTTNWGYVTEKAIMIDEDKEVPFKRIQDLVEEIKEKTSLKFWDCHMENIGIIKRGRKKKLVCIDTGKESFSGYSNAWGFLEPGPKCPYCSKYQCKCSAYNFIG